VQTSHFKSERRSAERFPVSLSVETDRGAGVTQDVSVSGLFMVTDKRLAVGDHLQLVVTLPDHDHALSIRLGLKGTVTRVEDVGDAVEAGIALNEGNLSMLQVSLRLAETASEVLMKET
jgi:hypothetical protein